MASLQIPASSGEIADKITILQIKADRINDPVKLQNVAKELSLLSDIFNKAFPETAKLTELLASLKSVNEKLWVIEDDIRDCERAGDFGTKFIELARAVYFTNDERFRVKKEINLLLDSEIAEEKSYKDYTQKS